MSTIERTRLQLLGQWLDDRLGLSMLREFLSHKTVPMHRYSVFYYLGGMTLFFFLVQVCTGVLLMLYYRPSRTKRSSRSRSSSRRSFGCWPIDHAWWRTYGVLRGLTCRSLS